MIAIIIMAGALMPIFYFMSSSNTATRQQKAEGVAANLAKEEMNRWLYVFRKEQFNAFSDDIEAPSPNGTIVIEGNEYRVSVVINKFMDSSLQMVYPKVKALQRHFQGCGSGQESGSWSASDFETPTQTIHAISKTSTYHLADIILRVRWRLANESQFRPHNQIMLVSRRAFL
jgi:hypothetical protein